MKLDFKQLSSIIGIISVLVMMLWGFLGNGWDKSWLAVVVGGVLIAILKVVYDKI